MLPELSFKTLFNLLLKQNKNNKIEKIKIKTLNTKYIVLFQYKIIFITF